MKAKVLCCGRIGMIKRSRVLVFFTVMLAALVCSTVIGTQSVHGSSCTTAACNAGLSYAAFVCNHYGGIAYWECPDSSAIDDYYFVCVQQPNGVDGDFDCGTHTPS